MKLKIILLLSIFAFSLNANENIKGLFASVGIGKGSTITNLKQSSLGGGIDIGYGINDKMLVHYSAVGYITDNGTMNINGVGISYYVLDNVYVKTIAGISEWRKIDTASSLDLDSGIGSSISVGYSFSAKSSLELNIHYGLLNTRVKSGITTSFDENIFFGGYLISYSHRWFYHD